MNVSYVSAGARLFEIAHGSFSLFLLLLQDYKMDKPRDDLFDSSFASFDHRSEAFRQKMFEHFLVKQSQLWPDIEEILENNEPVKPI